MNKYYLEELRQLREGTTEFARRYPGIAPMLMTQGGDPDVERILEGTAYLCSRLHERLDQTEPQVLKSLLKLTFPHVLLPIPSTTVMMFTTPPTVTNTIFLKKGTQVASYPVEDQQCIFSTCYDIAVMPISIESVQLSEYSGGRNVVSVSLKSNVPFRTFLQNALSFYLPGDYTQASQRFYILINELDRLEVEMEDRKFTLPASAVTYNEIPPEDLRMPGSKIINRTYINLSKYFTFPEQLLFINISEVGKLPFSESADQLTLRFYLKKTSENIPNFDIRSLAVNAVPAINLFRLHAEPIQIDHTQTDYVLRPQGQDSRFVEILGVDNAEALLPGGKIIPCRSYDLWQGSDDGLFYSLRVEKAEDRPNSTQYFMPLYFMNDGLRKDYLENFTISADMLCCNHTIPHKLRAGDVCRPTDNSPLQMTFTNISECSPMFPVTNAESAYWSFIGLMNMNLNTLASRDALRSLSNLFIPQSNLFPKIYAADMRRCNSILEFSSVDEERLFHGKLYRGKALHLSLSPSGFVSAGDLFLFTNALDNLLIDYAGINSYLRIILSISGKEGTKKWPPRMGKRRLI